MAASAKKDRASALCLAAGVVLYAFFAARGGASLPFLALAALFCWLAVWLPGRALASLLAGEEAGPALALTLGLTLFSLCAAAASASGLRWLVWLPAAGLVPYRLSPAGRGACAAPLPRLPGPALTVLLGLLGAASARFAHPAAVGQLIPQQDLYWNVGNAASFALGFPPQDMRYSGYTLTYHYLSELWAYGLAAGSGIRCYDAVAFALPPLLLLALLLVWRELGEALWPSGRRAAALPWAVLLLGGADAPALLRGASPFWNLFTIHLLTNINAVATATLLLGAFLVLLRRWEGNWRDARRWGPLALCFALLCAGKGPVAALAALALLCAVTALLPRLGRGQRLFALLPALGLLALFLVFYRLLFSAGAGASVTFSTHATLEKGALAPLLAAFKARSGLLYTAALPFCMALHAWGMAPFTLPLFAAGGLRALRRWREQTVLTLFCYALGIGGLLAFFLFDHPAMSQSYFAYAALPAMLVPALDFLPRLRGGVPRLAAGVLAGWSLCAGLCACLYLAGGGWQILTDPAAAVAAKPQYAPLTADEEEALLWLGGHMPADETFATNRMHTGLAEEGLSNVYTALSGRRAYMESFQYAKTNLGVPEEDIGRRYARMAALFDFDGTSDPAQAEAICRETGVAWLVYNKMLWGSDDALRGGAFVPCFENATVVIYHLTD